MAKQNIAETRKNEENKPVSQKQEELKSSTALKQEGQEKPTFYMTEAQLAKKCDAAIKVSHEAFPVIQGAFIDALLFFAIVGRPDFLNRLMYEVRPEHAHAFLRYFLSRLFREHGQWMTYTPVEKPENGKYTKGFRIYKPADEKAKQASVNGRAKTIELGVEGLTQIPWMTPDAVNQGGIAWTADNAFKALRSALTRSVKDGAMTEARAREFEKLMPATYKLEWDKIELPSPEVVAKNSKLKAELADGATKH